MPFDGLPDTPVTDRIIDRALELLGPNGERWLQGDGKHGDRVCAEVALYLATTEIRPSDPHFLIFRARRIVGDIPAYNDARGRTFAEIKQLLVGLKEKVPA